MSIRVFVADDHLMFREALRAPLSRGGDIEIVGESGTGAETLTECQRLQPDLLLLDIAMPDSNGIDLAREFARLAPGLKIIALTGYADRLFVEGMLKAGAKGYVVKTAGSAELVKAIRTVAGGKSYLCGEATAALVRRFNDRGDAGLAPLSLLGRREQEVLRKLAEGRNSPEISAELGIAVGTVDVHRRNIMRKLGIHTAVDLTRYAIRMGLVSA